jgi:hypothetical protein
VPAALAPDSFLLEAARGSTIRHIAVAHRIRIARRRTDSAELREEIR